MIQKSPRYVELCPQCRRGLDKTSHRLVTEFCGHSKCRVCLLQEIKGCLKCASSGKEAPPTELPSGLSLAPPRKSVIISPLEATKKCEQQGVQEEKCTEQIIKQSMKPDILFPTEIVKHSTTNYYHLKRLISQRYYSQGGGREPKEDKCCGTDKAIAENLELPSHIMHYCDIHRIMLRDPAAVEKHRQCKADTCDICNKKYSNFAKLGKHRRTHKKNYKCSSCNLVFKDKFALFTHNRVHTGFMAFSCDKCGKHFKQLYGLRRHILAHAELKKYACDVCKYRSLTKGDLNKHLKTHASAKLLVCNECGKQFKCKAAMLRHQKIHDPKYKSLFCPVCNVSFRRKDNLVRHQKNTHQSLGEVESEGQLTTIFEFDQRKHAVPIESAQSGDVR